MSSTTFHPDRDIPSLTGKVILITGGTAGLGAGTIAEFAKHDPAHIFFSGRNQKSADALISRIHCTSPDVKLTFLQCEISSLAAVKTMANNFLAQSTRLDILILNAGIMAKPPALSAEGYETTFATNHLGHALLFKLLTPTLLSTARANPTSSDVRIISLSSTAYATAPKQGIDFSTLKTTQDSLGSMIPGPKWSRYGQSKLANMLYADEIARHYPELTSVSVHPGVIRTALFNGVGFFFELPTMFMKHTPVEEGHYTQTWAATTKKENLINGAYYEPVGVLGKRTTAQARDEGLAKELWRWTEEQLEAWK